jgi:hypothetical protein
MKYKAYFFITGFVFVWNIVSMSYLAAKESSVVPQIEIEQTTFEFSPVIAGSEVTHVFQIHNKGSVTLNIPGIHTQ